MRATASILAAALLLNGCAADHFSHGVPNLAVVDARSNVLRGGDPTPDGWAWLAERGVTNDVQLDLGQDDPGRGIAVHRFPISFWRQLVAQPRTEDVTGAVAAIGPNTFVHCAHGQDRTGLVVAEWRVWRLGWSMADARREMLDRGFHRSLLGLDRFWRHRRWWDLRGDDWDRIFPFP